jgi:hypothetical protein
MSKLATLNPSLVHLAQKALDGQPHHDLMQSMMEDEGRKAGWEFMRELAANDKVNDANHVSVITGLAYALGMTFAENVRLFPSLQTDVGVDALRELVDHMIEVGIRDHDAMAVEK